MPVKHGPKGMHGVVATGYPFPTNSFRAQAIKVVDGDTVDLFVDTGFHGYHLLRVRVLAIDTAELHDKDEDQRSLARQAKKVVQELLECEEPTTQVDLNRWPLRIETRKADSFGRWLARITLVRDGEEINLASELLELGLAEPYKRRQR